MAALESSPTTTLQVMDTQLYADAVEWCPFPGMHRTLLCGTYQLLESEEGSAQSGQPQVRVGQLQIFHLQTPEDDPPSLALSHCIDMPGILDIKWTRQPHNGAALCGLVNAKGEFQLWKLSETETEGGTFGKVSPECSAEVEIDDCIGLSLDWAAQCEGSVPRVVTSDSQGGLTVLEIGGPTVTTVSHWHAHDFEAWICAFDQWNHDVIYSGSDDCRLKVWDLRVGATPVSTNTRFTMGVCSIQSNPQREHLLAVGSYDENLWLFDNRQMRHPLSTTGLGGGVWRVKWDPFIAHYILTATMHNGFHIVDSSKPDGEALQIVANYSNHASLAYGVDWCRLIPTRTTDTTLHGAANSEEASASDSLAVQALVASCSFYDHSLQLWQWSDRA